MSEEIPEDITKENTKIGLGKFTNFKYYLCIDDRFFETKNSCTNNIQKR